MRFFQSLALVGLAALGCTGEQFSTAIGRTGFDGGPSGTGGSMSGAGGSAKGGSTNGGGSNGGDGAGAGGAVSNGGTSAGGSVNGGSGNDGGMAGNGGTSAGGAVADGGTSAGGAVGNGGTSAGGVVGNGGASTGGIAGNGGTSAGGVVGNGGATNTQSGDCALGGDDCHNGTRCVEVTPGGYRVCAERIDEVTGCSQSGIGCCSSAECQGGQQCLKSPLAPTCGGIVIIDSNVCAADTCSTDSSCGASAICAPAGTFQRKVRMCVPAGCRKDSDCSALPGGACAPVSGGCCDNAIGLYCVYPNKSCRKNADCASFNCTVTQQGYSVCSTDPVICPL